jgi:catechol 2,3-dioxygenase-like lactoylglutathione lyase family enzyme
MTDPNFVILYVKDQSASTAFYADVLGRAPVDVSPTFAMFALSSGIMLDLWSRENVEPAANAAAGGAELAIAVADADAVRAVHRLRVFAPTAP